MATKEEFKEFVKRNPEFASSVSSGKYTWQSLFEIYDMYGSNSKVWEELRKTSTAEKSGLNFKSIIDSIKGINLDTFSDNLTNIQKAVSFLEEITTPSSKKKEKETAKETENVDKFYSD